jgi:hypothetical protein
LRADAGEIAKVPVSRGLSTDRRIRFTVPFRKTITIAARWAPETQLRVFMASEGHIKTTIDGIWEIGRAGHQ